MNLPEFFNTTVFNGPSISPMDILIGGSTDFDGNDAALAILEGAFSVQGNRPAWRRTRSPWAASGRLGASGL